MSKNGAPPTKLEKLRELSLFGLPLNMSLHEGLVSLIDFQQLTHLTLAQCELLPEFLANMVESINGGTLSLQHLGLEIPDIPQGSEQSFNRDFDLFLRRCKHLRSFSLVWQQSDTSRPRCLLNALEHLGKELKLLSLHWDGPNDIETLEPEQLKQVCTLCPNLEQLGYQISDKKLEVDAYDHRAYENTVSLPRCNSKQLFDNPSRTR
jgi:hypothetical protein